MNREIHSPKTILLSTAYFAPIQYYSKLASDAAVVIEKHENFNKQSYRNRCTIFSANGLLDLVVPVVKTKELKMPITEVEISYDTGWQKLHFKAIESAYRRSPFYEYYIDDLIPFFSRQQQFLYDFNMQIMHTICKLIKVPVKEHESKSYMDAGVGIEDFRDCIHPKESRKTPDLGFVQPYYMQVFAGKYEFQSNLSILDLLFNVGPESTRKLKNSFTS